MTPATVIVGASVGGVATARELRAAGYDGEVTLVGDEAVLPYDRPPLSKALLAGTATAESVTLLTEASARDLGVRLVLGQAARHLDPGAGVVQLAGGERLRYDDVVIATGSRARRSPWGEPPGLHHLRTLADAEALRDDLKRGGPLVVIGAGLIGAEVAATARQLGVAEVTLVDPAPVPMSRILDPATAARLGRRHREHGVTTRFSTEVESVTREPGGGLAVRTADGAVLPAATVVVGIGAVANDDWLAASGLTAGGGLHCDERCRALGAPRVHAVGDVARWRHAGHGTLVRAEHWTNAIEQARYVAADIVRPGSQGPYQPVGYVWSDQYDAVIQVTGRPAPGLRQVTVERPGQPGAFAVLYATSAGTLAAAVTVSWPRATVAARRAVAAGTPLVSVHAVITAAPPPAVRNDGPAPAQAGASVTDRRVPA
jgi:NADPH-dependent 2,4-dienoyl-CoA reductase/sulfur reductase-like enzyme